MNRLPGGKGVATTADEKRQLFEGLRHKEDPAAQWQFLLLVMIVVAIVLLLVLPKIYLRNAIYYESRAIDRLQTQYGALMEENRILNRRVESLKVKNQILDAIF
ncbi:MAG: hypothetical protein GXO33_00455 [Epsilonproteobacteria bacterium]|nr:hypothetical protein [Campylobacterota bacterium]